MLRLAVLLCTLVLALPGCTQINRFTGWQASEPDPIGLLAVMPIEAQQDAAKDSTASKSDPAAGGDAGKVVTAEIYSVLSNSPEWRFVPDLTVSDHLSTLNPLDEAATRAYKLGQAVRAESVLFGTVTRYRERVGADLGAQQPAAIAIQLKLLSVSRRKIVWHGEFNEAQQSLSENLMNAWQFWRGGPKWFTAREFAHLGVEQLLEDLDRKLR